MPSLESAHHSRSETRALLCPCPVSAAGSITIWLSHWPLPSRSGPPPGPCRACRELHRSLPVLYLASLSIPTHRLAGSSRGRKVSEDPFGHLCALLLSRFVPEIRIGGQLTVPPLPHHRAYGSVPRRFDPVKPGQIRRGGGGGGGRRMGCAAGVCPPGVRGDAPTP